MKIIKSLSLVTVALFTTALLHAQNTQTESTKPVEIKKPATATAGSPMAENKVPVEETKTVVLTRDPDLSKKSLTPEQLKIFNGEQESPKDAYIPMPNTVGQKPPPLTKSAAARQQPNQ